MSNELASASIGLLVVTATILLYYIRCRTARIIKEAKKEYGPSAEPCSPGDYMWKLDTEYNKCMISAAMIVRNGTLEDLNVVTEKLIQDPWFRRFTDRLALFENMPFWVKDTQFKKENHVHRVLLDVSQKPTNSAELKEWIGQTIVADLPIDRPLWKMVILENYEKCDDGSGDTMSCVLLMAHHVLGDGVAFSNMMMSMLDTESHVKGIKVEKKKKKPVSPTKSQVKPRQPFAWLTWLFVALYTVPIMGKIMLSKADVNPFKTQNVSGRKVVGMLDTPIEMTRMNSVRNKLGMSVNDVFMGVISCALQRLFARIEPDNDVESIKAAMMVNMRSNPYAVKMENQFATPVFDMDVSNSDPLVACNKMRPVMKGMKTTPISKVFFANIALVANLFPYIFNQTLLDYLASKTSCILSNVPGPSERMYFNGKLLERISAWSPQRKSVSFGMTMFTLGGKVNIGAIMDTGAADKAQAFVDEFVAVFEELEMMVSEQVSAKSKVADAC
ncbi:hypothetical protein SARC_01123 [Sphaeroforma arctica JP610]|uniref:Uncharacterized protein n=1 Tax=Sphaeroforma arctica JP610 TaxID=667725 RepID=A0A0L0GCV6_9EUKA|nr:hypothetical protein SARC_01123 [Sphaeroforma arctica JP610]KNC86744.1 hypothetical protein SARC_01123 [Sphaeroforma arctica JP610]|eukprot:XP_014160646.1 hypothetical protein SARC_01123 [Sphaeroforma arctica JP610]